MPSSRLPGHRGAARAGCSSEPAAQPVPAVVGAAAAAARDGQRRRFRRRLVRGGRPGARRATGGPGRSGRDQSFADLARVVRTGALLAAVRDATVAGADGEAAAAPFAAGPLAVQPQRRGRRAGRAPWRRSPPRCPPASCCRWRPAATRRWSGRWSCTGCAPATTPGQALADTVREVAAAAPGSRLNLLLTDGDDDRRDRLGRHALVPRRARPPHGRGLRAVRRRPALARGPRPHPAAPRPAPTSCSPRSRSPPREPVPSDPHPARGRHGRRAARRRRCDGLTRHAQDAAAQVVLRRARQRAVRGDHRLPEYYPTRAEREILVDRAARDRRGDRRPHPGRAGLRLLREDPASARRAARAAHATCRSTSARAR